MKILSVKPGHDGAIAWLEDGELVFSLEGEKSGFERHTTLHLQTILEGLRLAPCAPDIIAMSGWDGMIPHCAGYGGIATEDSISTDATFLGKKTAYFSSSHERSHLLSAYGMSPWPMGTACYALIWEGGFGCFYRINESLGIDKIAQVMTQPGERYVYPYVIAQPNCLFEGSGNLAGTVMALCAFEKSGSELPEEKQLIDRIVNTSIEQILPYKRDLFFDSFLYDAGIDSGAAKRVYRRVSDRIFDSFFVVAEKTLTERLPLLIAGGCGLNCEWNSRWAASGLFPEVFVPPCPNDAGSAIGTAIDAQFQRTGNAKISWSVYAGSPFDTDAAPDPSRYTCYAGSPEIVARFVGAGHVIAWVNGKYEIGPRALGARSLLASPFEWLTRDRLNHIKNRESFRPVAPICLEEDMGEHFSLSDPSPYMLYFSQVRNKQLKAITHVDSSARPQSVNAIQNPQMYNLLREFKKQSGVGVLCNTSLNFSGKGFINRMSDLLLYVEDRDIAGFVVDDLFYVKNAFAGEVAKAVQLNEASSRRRS